MQISVVFVALPFGINVWRRFDTGRELVQYLRQTQSIVAVNTVYEW